MHNAPFSAPIYIFADEVYPHIKSEEGRSVFYLTYNGMYFEADSLVLLHKALNDIGIGTR